MKLAHNLTLQL